MTVVMYFAPAVLFADQTAHAAPIVDPRAPIQFQPTITQTSTGVPVSNIPAPNGNGVSLGQYQSFNVGPEGLVLNNSTQAGVPLLGGALGANPNLNGRSASLIINQVTSNAAAVLAGPVEVFGIGAPVVVAAPGGVSVSGMSLTNIPNLTLTTGVPQFITGVGGTPTDFAHAGAVAYNVTGGAISINGLPGVNGPGPGIDGTVSNIDLIGQAVSVNAPIRGNEKVNIVTGNQLVSPSAISSAGNTYGTASNGLPNNVTGIQTANGLAIDASQFGSVTAGQIYIVQNAQGLGANMQGPLTATAGNVFVNANGDVSVGQTFASQDVNLNSAGTTTMSGTGLANQNFTVAAKGDINATAPVSAGQNVSLTAGNNLNAASVAANGAASLTAGQSMSIGSLSANSMALQTTNGDLTVGGLSAPGTISAQAGRDLTVNGAVQGGSTVALTGARNATVNGAVTSVGDTNLTATTGSAAVNGNLQSNGAATVTAGQNASIGGTTQAQGPVSITAQSGSITGQGSVTSSQGAVNLTAGQAIALNGAVQSGTTIAANAGTDASFGGTVSAPDAVTIQSGGNTTLAGNVTSGNNLSVVSGGSTQVNGSAASIGNMTLAANGGTLSTTGNVVSLGTLNATGQRGVSLGGTAYSGGNATIGSSAGNVAVAGAVSTPGTLTVNAAQDATIAGTVQTGQSTTITAGRDADLNGDLSVNGIGNASVTAGRDINGTGAVNVAHDTTLNAGNNIGISGAIQTGNNLSATAANNLNVGATTAVGNSTLTATNGSATLAGDALSGGTTTLTAGTNVATQGSVTSLGDLSVNAKGGNLTASGSVSTAGNATLNAGQTMALNGQTTVSKDATLTATNITTQGLAVGGNLTATAANNLDTSVGQLNAPFSATAPALSVNGNATLTGANVTTANAVVGGTTTLTGTQSLTTGGTAAFKGDASLNGGTVSNVGTQMAAGNLNVSGTTVSNTGALSSLQTANITATDLNNSGSIYGPTANFNVSNATTNSGSLLTTNALNLTTNSLSNSGLIFAGDVNNPTAPTGNTTVTVTGGNGSYDNTNGKILAQNIATLNLPNQTLDPSSAAFGTVNGGNGLNLSAQSVNNSGTWTLPGTAVTVSTTNGLSNAGTINQGTGSLTLNGALNNSGSVTANDLTINGSLANQTGGTVTANDALTLNGSGTNSGTVQATNTLNITGSSYDNSNGITRAGNANSPAGSGNASINLSGDLGNAAGSLTATNDLSITANNVNNSAAANISTTTSTSTVVNTPLLMSTVIGTEDFWYIDAGQSGSLTPYVYTLTSTLGGLLSPAGNSTMVQDPHPSAYELLQNQMAGVPIPTVNLATYYRNAPNANNIASGPNAYQPVATSGTVTFVRLPYAANSSGASGPAYVWVVQDGTVPTGDSNGPYQTQTFAIPTVTETRTSVAGSNTPSVIAAGNNLNLTANTLNNQGGTVSAGHDANVTVQTLNNGGVTYTSSVTDTVDSASLQAFMSGVIALTPTLPSFSGLIPEQVSVRGSGNMFGTYCDSSGCGVGSPNPPAKFTFLAPNAVTVQSVTSTSTIQTPAGQILAGNNVNLSGGNLTNAGSIAAGNNVNVTAASFTNQGTNNGSKTVTAGCASGFTGCSTTPTTNPNSETYSYTQTNSTVTAGNDIVIAANQVSNTYGNLVAKRDVVIGGAGTTAANPTQAASVTNTSGAIEAGNDVNINAATLTNTIAAPAQIHQNYGTSTPFTGCTSNCEAYVDVQSAAPATITANHNVSLNAGTFSNVGSLVTGLNNVTINATGAASSDNQYLNAYWASNLTHDGSSYPAWGCANNPALCAQLYGSAYSSGTAQDPAGLPSSVGLPDFVPGTIQAGNTLAVTSPTLTNTGNVIGTTVALTGSTLVNGITNPNVYTPPPAVSGQVISLGPVSVSSYVGTTVDAAGFVTNANGQRTSVTGAAGLPSNSPVGVQTVGKPTPPVVSNVGTPQTTSVKTIAGQTVQVSYLTNNPAAQVVNAISSASLIAALPANLQPGSVPFYYDPYTENQQIEQAALQATGKSSFYSTPSATDSTSQASINNQDKLALYGAALQYAEKNNIALGTQLSQTQLAQINAPMLWYVEQTVPEPGCTATGNGACPTVQALMPQILLPQNYAVVNADGEITGTNVALNYANSILNTGTVTAQNLTVNTNSLTNEQRSTNVGTIYTDLGDGVGVTTGTVVQTGGFMSAANYQLNVDSLNQIGGALQQIGAGGAVDTAGTQALLANLKNQLGSQFTQSTVSDNLHTDFIADSGGIGAQIMGAIAAVVAAVIMQPEISAGIMSMTGAADAAAEGAFAAAAAGAEGSAIATAATVAGGTFAVGGVANAALSVGLTSFLSSAVGQVVGTGQFDFSTALQNGLIGAVTAGLTNGITLDGATPGWSSVASPNSIASLAGVQNVGNTLVPQAGVSAAGSLPGQALALTSEALIQAGVQTGIGGGSFLTNLRNSAVSDAAAVGAYAIGNAFNDTTGFWTTSNPLYAAEHAVLGCAASAANGTGCVSGAVGAAMSALIAPTVRDELYNGSQDVTYTDNGDGTITQTSNYGNSAFNAATAAVAMLTGSAMAGVLGLNASTAALAAENEALNNSLSTKYQYLKGQTAACNGQPIGCYQQLLVTTQAAYQQAQQDVASNCGAGGNAAACQTARNDVAQLYLNQRNLQLFVQNTPNCTTVGCIAATTGGLDLAGLGLGAVIGKLISAARGAFGSAAGSSTGQASASSSVPTGGDVDLPGVYNGQVQGVATNNALAGAASAQNIANAQKLAEVLRLESANSPFAENGTLTQSAIGDAQAVPGLGPGQLANQNIPAGFGKYTTQTYQSPAGPFQVHFYMNPTTGDVYYGADYKAIFNNMSGVPKKP
ncbi:filamentous hemagglutinin [Burkholderia territorii]|nr:filamentous hemagglutinin [Burkholderia territorii]